MTEQPALPAPSELTSTIADALANQWAATEITFDSDGNPVLNVSNAPLTALANDPTVLSSLATAFNQGTSLVTWNAPPTAAINYARQRSAELVGMRRLPNGQLAHNPDPKWSLSDTTRDRLRSLIVSNLQSPESMRDLKERIEALPEFASIFGEYRAEMIARTELQVALNNGNLSSINRDGYSHVQVLDSEDCGWTSHDDPDKANGSIRTLAEAREYPIAHPHCVRAFSPVITEKGSFGSDWIGRALDAIWKDGGAAGASGGGIGVGTGLTGYSLEGQRRRCPLNCRNGKRPNGNDCPHKSHTRRRDS